MNIGHFVGRTRVSGRRSGHRALVGALIFATAVALSACGTPRGQIRGKMYVPTGLGGRAQWGDIWLVRDYDQLRIDLAQHERLLVLALLNKDAEFVRSQQKNILTLAELSAKVGALARNEIPTEVVHTSIPPITPLTPVDSLIAAVHVRTRPATTAERRTIERRKRALQDSLIAVRDRMQDAISDLMRQRSNQKDVLLADADAIVTQHRVQQVPVAMDGAYLFKNIPAGTYGLYARYVLMKWYVLTTATVTKNRTATKDIPRLPSVVTQSNAVTTIDALVNQTSRM